MSNNLMEAAFVAMGLSFPPNAAAGDARGNGGDGGSEPQRRPSRRASAR